MTTLYHFLDLGAWGLSPVSWGLFFLTAALVGFSKTGLPGVSILTVPLMAAIFPAKLSVGLLLPMLMAGDLLSTYRYWRYAKWRYCFPYLFFVGGGIAVASLVAGRVDGHVFTVVIGWVVLFLLGMNAVTDYVRRHQPSRPPAERPSLAASASFGLSVGFFSALANSGGPIMTLYMLVSRLGKYEILGTLSVTAFVMNWAKIPLFVSMGMIDARTLKLNLASLPLIALGGLLGFVFAKKIPQKAFKDVVLLLAAVASVKLIVG